ncbi:MAG: HD domain-containing protein [Oscillospiraceae bacterium]|nr:HD domain-containing protein [Oscillospiraceae bacterium]
MKTRLEKQIEFLVEADKMKTVFRQNTILDKSRFENDAEHSWHFAIMAMVLYEYADSSKVDICRVLKMALVHDLIEIYAGDTFAYDAIGNQSKEKRESESADKLFAMLPEEQGKEIRSLWKEFDMMETNDAKFASAIDVLQPFLQNYYTQGKMWKHHKITSDKVYKRMQKVKNGLPELWTLVDNIIKDSIEKGYMKQ